MKQENKHIAMAAAQEKIARLRQGFLRRIPDMLAQAERLLVQLVAEPSEACRQQLHILLHSIHGSAGSFGFSPLANASAEGERLLTEPETEQSTLHYDELRRIIRWLYTLTQEQLNLEHRISDTEFTLPIAAQRPEEGYVGGPVSLSTCVMMRLTRSSFSRPNCAVLVLPAMCSRTRRISLRPYCRNRPPW